MKKIIRRYHALRDALKSRSRRPIRNAILVIGGPESGRKTLMTSLNYKVSNQRKKFTGSQQWTLENQEVMTMDKSAIEEDPVAWRKHIKKCHHFHSVLIVLPCNELFNLSKIELETLSKALMVMLEDINQCLGYQLPCYLVVSKLDSLPGYFDYLKTLTEEEKHQPLGMMCYDRLTWLNVFNQSMLMRAYKESVVSDEEMVGLLTFCALFTELTHKVMGLKSHSSWEVMLAGAYFFGSNGPIHGGALGINDDLALQCGPVESCKALCFSQELVAQINANKQERYKPTRSGSNKRGLKLVIKLMAIFLLFNIFYSFLFNQYIANKNILLDAKNMTQQVMRHNNGQSMENSQALLDALKILAIKRDASVRGSLVGTLATFGLNNAKSINPALTELEFMLLNYDVMVPVVVNMKDALKNFHDQWSTLSPRQKGQYYSLLKGYSMLIHPQHMDSAFLNTVLSGPWIGMSNGVLSKDQTIALLKDYLLNYEKYSTVYSLTLDHALVVAAKKQFATSSGQNSYDEYISSQPMAAKNSSDYIRESQGINSIYTVKQWNMQAKKQLKHLASHGQSDSWMFPNVEPRPNANEYGTLEKQYFDDYQNAWVAYAQGIKIENTRNLKQVLGFLQSITDIKGAYSQLLANLMVNLTFSNAHVNGITSLKSLTKASWIKQYKTNIKMLQSELSNVQYAADPNQALENLTARIMDKPSAQTALGSGIMAVNSLDLSDLPKAQQKVVRRLLLMPYEKVWGFLLQASAKELESQWNNTIYGYYREHFMGNYPFSQGNNDVDMGAMNAFMNPKKGIYWNLMDKSFSSFVEKKGGHWQAKKKYQQSLPFNHAFLMNMDLMTKLSQALYENNNSIGITLNLYPEPTHGVGKTSLFISNQKMTYFNGPETWHTLTWPGKPPYNGSTILINTESKEVSLTSSGEWGFPHLIDQGKVLSGNTYQVIWTLHKNGMIYPIKMEVKGIGPFLWWRELAFKPIIIKTIV